LLHENLSLIQNVNAIKLFSPLPTWVGVENPKAMPQLYTGERAKICLCYWVLIEADTLKSRSIQIYSTLKQSIFTQNG